MLGDRLRRIRRENKLTQQNIADVLGVDRTTYTVYESGLVTPSSSTLVKLSQIYNVTIGYLIGVEENHPELRRDPEKPIDEKILGSDPISLLKKEEKELLLYYRVLSAEEKAKLIEELKTQAKNNEKV